MHWLASGPPVMSHTAPGDVFVWMQFPQPLDTIVGSEQ
jgi:hypothetical protein